MPIFQSMFETVAEQSMSVANDDEIDLDDGFLVRRAFIGVTGNINDDWSGIIEYDFAENGTITGTARADIAQDIRPSFDPVVQPGDSVAVTIDRP